MMRLVLVLACLLLLSRAAQAQTSGCGVGQTPPSTGCGISDMQVGGALSATDAIGICQQGTGGCPASATTWKLNQIPLLPRIYSSFSATAPITYNSATGVIACPTCGTSTGGTITLAPGLASTPGTYNTGTQTVTGGGTISPQLFYEAHATAYTVVAADAGKLLTATGAITFTVPNPGAAGSAAYSFGYDGSHGYNLTTTGGTASIYGCGTTGTTISLTGPSSIVTDGVGWQCTTPVAPGGGVTLSGNNTWTGTNTYNANILGLDVTAAGAAIALDNTVVCGQEIDATSATAVTATLASTFPAQCTVTIAQQGAGKVTVAAGTGTLHTACSTVGTRAQYSVIRIKSAATAGTAIVSGDCG